MMNNREKSFPTLVVVSGISCAAGGLIMSARGSEVIGGFCMGWGLALAFALVLVWASPMNERRS